MARLKRNPRWPDKQPLRLDHILRWAAAHQRRTGRWPGAHSGWIREAPNETWRRIDEALKKGFRGLPGDSSLKGVLAARFGARNQLALPRLRQKQILEWADAHFERHGAWPTRDSGPIDDAPGEKWSHVHAALRFGHRGLAGGTTLAEFLLLQRGVAAHSRHAPPLDEPRILGWADAHQRRTGRWPTAYSGGVRGVPDEVWANLEAALRTGRRGLPGGSSLAKLLEKRRGRRNTRNLPPLSERRIIEWARTHYRIKGRWPMMELGEVIGAPGEKWVNIDSALRKGHRGLRGGSSLSKLLAPVK